MSLTFGYNQGLVAGLKAAWGARWIVGQDGYVDFVWNRQDAFGEEERRTRLYNWLSAGAGRAAENKAAEMLRDRVIDTRKAKPVILYQDREGAVVGNTNGSAGYLYVAAWRYEDLPEGHPTRGLERVLDDPARKEVVDEAER